jgi:hypothetical protein
VYYTAGNQQKAQFLSDQYFGGAQVLPVPAALNVTAGDAVAVLAADYSPGKPAASSSSNPLLPAGPAVALPGAAPWFAAC